MLSPAENRRAKLEQTLHAAALLLIGFALYRALRPPDPGTSVHVSFDATPSPAFRDSLRAAFRTGTRVTWSGATLQPLALASERLREPGASVRVTVAAAAPVELSDALAVLDTVKPGATGSTVIAAEPSGTLRAQEGKTRAAVEAGPQPVLHSVLVLGRASFEAKFVVAALEERGWTVETRLTVAPGADVTQGIPAALDTAHYSAVIALDTALGASARNLFQYVRSGGGLILLGDAANAAAARAIAPAHPGPRTPAKTRDVLAANPLDGLAINALESLRPDAVRLGLRGDKVTLAARREGAGRVLQIGYDETWRWRMQGGDDAVAAHRVWWSRLVASVAYAGAATGNSAEGAPLARLYDAFGPPAVSPATSSPSNTLPSWLLPLVALLLLIEWGSRRLRGAK